MTTKTGDRVTKKAFGGIAAIVFEIFYMAGPFAAYFYGVYNLVLKFLDRFPILSSLNGFFFPHIVRQTTI